MVEKEHVMIEKGHVIIKINMGHLNIIMMSFLHLDVYDMFINKETRYVYTENTFWVKKNTLYLKNHIKLSMLTTLLLIARYHCTENVYDVFPLN